MVDENTQQASPAPKLSKEERSKIMSDAAKRRWEKARRAKAKATKTAPKAPPAPTAARKRSPAPREFSSALRTAEKRLATAIMERAKAAATYAVLSAEIPSLQRLIVALRNPLGTVAEFPGAPHYGTSAPTLEQIVGDQPLAYQNPPRTDIPMGPAPFSVVPVPPQLHPANTMTMTGRGGGGAIGVDIGDGEAEEDENKFLDESAVAGGQWH